FDPDFSRLIWIAREDRRVDLQRGFRVSNQSGIGSKPANISADSDNVLSGIQSQTSKNLFHIARTLGFLCAASIASCDFHSETSMMVPLRERMITGSRSVTRPSLRRSEHDCALTRVLHLPSQAWGDRRR